MNDKPVIISVHLPKSGGTSVRHCLQAQFGEGVLFDYGRGPLGPRAHDVEHSLPQGIEVVHGHFKPKRYASIQNSFWMTFLREPIDLLLSFYFFWKTMPHHGGDLHRRFLDEAPTLEDFAKWPSIQRLTSDTYFGDFDMGRMDFIGFHETRHQDMERVNQLIGTQLDGGRHENKTSSGNGEREAIAADAALMGRLKAILADDVRFYEAMRSKHGL